jgi:hypothetical protein
MDGTPDRNLIAALLASRATPAEASRLARQQWPGGLMDRSEPAALEWVRRWGPSRITADMPDCSCTHGHCAICN